MLLAIIINTVLCLLGLIPAIGVQVATVMSGASPGAGRLGHVLGLAAFILPAVPIVSIIGSWIAYFLNQDSLTIAFVALPWVYALVLGAGLSVFFWLGSRA